MKRYIVNIISVVLVLFHAGNSAAQSAQEVEQQVKTYLDQVHYWRYEYSPEDSGVSPNANQADSVIATNKALMEYLKSIGNNNAILKTQFKTLDEAGMKIATSDDKRMRIYSWDTETGDDKHIYNAIAQFEGGGGTTTQVLHDISGSKDQRLVGNLYAEIYTAGNYYLPVYHGILSTKDAIKGIKAFSIEGGQLKDANIFQTTGGAVNNIDLVYDYYANYEFKTMKEKYTIKMNKQQLSIPLLDDDKLNGRADIYTLNGQKFVLKK